MRFEALDDWLRWLEQLHPRKWDLGLDRVGRVATRLGVTKPAETVFLIAGTNGKGSTVAYLEALALEAGYRVGSTTSPHLARFNERICLHGKPVSDAEICEAFDRIDRARGSVSLTYFEFAALAAMTIFEDARLDVAILEVGLGGRLDAMNVASPDVSVVTTVDLDHESWLGRTRAKIGREKAGIFRTGVPAVYGDRLPVASVKQEARRIGAPLSVRGEDFDCVSGTGEWCYRATKSDVELFIDDLPMTLLPRDNAVTAIEAYRRAGLALDHGALRTVLAETTLAGRLQSFDGEVPVLLDVAHNPQAASYLRDHLRAVSVSGITHGIVAMYADKDCESVLAIMDEVVDRWYVAGFDEARAASPGDLAARGLNHRGSEAVTCATVALAYECAKRSAAKGDRIVVFGSFVIIAEMLDLMAGPHRGARRR